MQANPYAPPTAPLGPSHGAPVDPQRAAEIQARIKRLNNISLALGVPALGLQAVARIVIGGTTGTLLLVLAGLMLIAGLSFYAQMKGRSGWWGLLGLASILGFIALAVLPSRCHGCGVKVKGRRCAACGAPSGVG